MLHGLVAQCFFSDIILQGVVSACAGTATTLHVRMYAMLVGYCCCCCIISFMIYEGLHPQVRKQDMFALKESFLVCINGTLLKMDTFALRYTV